jgi:hypothetical protein
MSDATKKNWVRVSQATNLPFKKQTFYQLFHFKKFPEIFIKFAGALFIDLDALQRVMEEGRAGRAN